MASFSVDGFLCIGFKMESRPFRSVKEAVVLYGKRILAPELYANVLQQMELEGGGKEEEDYLRKIESVRDELAAAKRNLEKAKERSGAMSRSLSSIQQELEETKRNLQLLKGRRSQSVDGSWMSDFKTQSQRFEEEKEEEEVEESEVHEKQRVAAGAKMAGESFRNSPSVKKKKKTTTTTTKKRPLMFSMRAFFFKK